MRRTLSIGALLVLVIVAGRAVDAGATHYQIGVQPADVVHAQTPASSRFAVSLGSADIAQMKTIGLDWFLWDGALDWAASDADPDRVPDGLHFPFLLHIRDKIPEDRITTAARRFPGSYWL